MHLTFLINNDLAAPVVGKSHADARILHRTGKADRFAVFDRFVIVGLDGLERFDKAGLRPDDLAVGQHLAGANGVAVADLPRGDADKIRHLIQKRFGRKAGLRHAEAAERARGRIVRIVGVALDFKILIVIRARGMRARAAELAGDIDWKAGTAGGTKVLLSMPLRKGP